MGFGLIWIEAAAFALAFAGLAVACLARIELRLVRGITTTIAVLLPFIPGFGAFVAGWVIRSENVEPEWLMPYAIGLNVTYAIGLVLILRRGKPLQTPTPARSWSIRAALVATLFSFILLMVTLGFIDATARLRIAVFHTGVMTQVTPLIPGPVPDGKNAFHVYQEITNTLRDDQPDWLGQVHQPDFDPDRLCVTRFLARHRVHLDRLKSASRMPFYQSFSLDFAAKLPDIEFMQYCETLLLLEAKVKAAEGDAEGSLSSLMFLHRMGEQLGRTPILYTYYRGLSGHLDAVDCMESSLHRGLQVVDSGYDPSLLLSMEGMRRAQRVDATIGLSVFGYSVIEDDFLGINRPWGKPMNVLYRIFCSEHDRRFIQSLWSEVDDALALPLHEAYPRLKELKIEERGGILAAIAMPDNGFFAMSAARFGQVQARFAVMDAGMAAERYRSTHGRYPDSIEDLVPEFLGSVPTDPFTGDALRARILEGGWVAYSIGPDLEDQGGEAYDQNDRRGDICFYLGQAFEKRRLSSARSARIEKISRRAKSRYTRKSKGRPTELHRAVLAGDADAVRSALEKDQDPNIVAGKDLTALHLAAVTGQADLVRLLVSLGADLDAVDLEYGVTPFQAAMVTSDRSIRGMLTQAGLEADALPQAKGRLDAIEYLLEKGALVEVRARRGDQAIHTVALDGVAAMASILVKSGSDPNAQTYSGASPLHFLTTRRDSDAAEIFTLLVEAGADPNISTEKGVTPLQLAAMLGNPDQVTGLLEAGAEVNRADSKGLTPLHAAVVCDRKVLIEMAKATGVPLNKNRLEADFIVTDPVVRERVVARLLAAGADVAAVTESGASVHQFASQHGVESIIDRLAAERP